MIFPGSKRMEEACKGEGEKNPVNHPGHGKKERQVGGFMVFMKNYPVRAHKRGCKYVLRLRCEGVLSMSCLWQRALILQWAMLELIAQLLSKPGNYGY